MKTRKMILAVAVLASVSLLAASAQAGDYGRYCGYGRYPADLTSLYSGGQIKAPPHFSIHPPVYYSRPVARTYGFSPWAYPPETITPGAPRKIGPVMVNPYVSQEASVAQAAIVLPREQNTYVAQETAPEAEAGAEQ